MSETPKANENNNAAHGNMERVPVASAKDGTSLSTGKNIENQEQENNEKSHDHKREFAKPSSGLDIGNQTKQRKLDHNHDAVIFSNYTGAHNRNDDSSIDSSTKGNIKGNSDDKKNYPASFTGHKDAIPSAGDSTWTCPVDVDNVNFPNPVIRQILRTIVEGMSVFEAKIDRTHDDVTTNISISNGIQAEAYKTLRRVTNTNELVEGKVLEEITNVKEVLQGKVVEGITDVMKGSIGGKDEKEFIERRVLPLCENIHNSVLELIKTQASGTNREDTGDNNLSAKILRDHIMTWHHSKGAALMTHFREYRSTDDLEMRFRVDLMMSAYQQYMAEFVQFLGESFGMDLPAKGNDHNIMK